MVTHLGKGLKISVKRTFYVQFDLDHQEIAFIKESFIDSTIREVEVSPSGNFMIALIGGVLMVLLDAHTLQIVSINTLNHNDGESVHFSQMSHIKFMNEYLIASVEYKHKLLLWRMDTKKLYPVIYLDFLEPSIENKEDFKIENLIHYESDVKALQENRFRGKFWTRNGQTKKVTYDELFDLKVLSSWLTMEQSKKNRYVLEELRNMSPSYLIIFDSEKLLSIIWTDILEVMFGYAPFKVHKDQISVGYSLSTDKIVQCIKHTQACQVKDIITLDDKSKLKIQLQKKEVVDLMVTTIAKKRYLVVMYMNLQLQILNFDLINRGFMEHSCYNQSKR